LEEGQIWLDFRADNQGIGLEIESRWKVDGKSMKSYSKVSLEVNTAHVLMELSTTKDVSTSISVEQSISQ
jgi:hypothetical protein